MMNIANKGLVSGIYMELLLQKRNKQTYNPIEKGARNRHFTEVQIAKQKHMKICLNALQDTNKKVKSRVTGTSMH